MIRPRRLLRHLAAFLAPSALAAVLAACSPNGSSTPGNFVQPAPQPVSGEVLGSGAVRVALLLPTSATGNAGTLAKDIKDAANLALQENPSANLQVLVKDTLGTPEGARAAVTAAISQGARLIIGPLFSQDVAAATAVTKPARVPLVAFSTDTSIASRGAYLLSFLPKTDIERIIQFAASQGRRSYAALLPANGYGAVAEAALQGSAARFGGRVVAIERYELDRVAMQTAAESIAEVVLSGQVDALLMPDAGDAAPFLAQVLAAKGVGSKNIQYLGSGQWDDPRVAKESNLKGGWYPAPDKSGFAAFSQRFRQAYGREPARTASLGYDSISLAAGLSGRFGDDGFSDNVLTNRNGFAGVDGIFRLLSDGTNQRGLAIYEVAGERTDPKVIEPAPTSFATSGF